MDISSLFARTLVRIRSPPGWEMTNLPRRTGTERLQVRVLDCRWSRIHIESFSLRKRSVRSVSRTVSIMTRNHLPADFGGEHNFSAAAARRRVSSTRARGGGRMLSSLRPANSSTRAHTSFAVHLLPAVNA